jgi:ribonuclease-3
MLGHLFQNRGLMQHALTHPSCGHACSQFQRLELLGDAVLNLTITEDLLKRYPDNNEGQISKRRAYLVSREAGAIACQKLKLNELISVGSNVDLQKSSIITDALEAVIGAIYLDSNFETCKAWILNVWGTLLLTSPPLDPLSALQEYTQSSGIKTPVYKEIGRRGLEHELTHQVSVSLSENVTSYGEGQSMKIAKKNAAEAMLIQLGAERRPFGGIFFPGCKN